MPGDRCLFCSSKYTCMLLLTNPVTNRHTQFSATLTEYFPGRNFKIGCEICSFQAFRKSHSKKAVTTSNCKRGLEREVYLKHITCTPCYLGANKQPTNLLLLDWKFETYNANILNYTKKKLHDFNNMGKQLIKTSRNWPKQERGKKSCCFYPLAFIAFLSTPTASPFPLCRIQVWKNCSNIYSTSSAASRLKIMLVIFCLLYTITTIQLSSFNKIS